MTCIVGVADRTGVWMGGDSAGVSGWLSHVRSDTKVFTRGPFLMGFTTSFRMGQLLRHALDVPEQQDGEDDEGFMVTAFVDAVRRCLKDGGYAKKDGEQESGGTFLVGYRGRLFRIDSDYQVILTANQYDAVGSGNELALGALHATTGSAAKRIQKALDAAEHFSAGVRGPFTILHQPK